MVITSAKKTFFAGGNLTDLLSIGPDQAQEVFDQSQVLKAQLRRLEKLGVPTVAAINGAALGGGLEIASPSTTASRSTVATRSACPRSPSACCPVAAASPASTRLLGVSSALMDVLLQGQRYKPAVAQAKGLVHDLVATQDELLPAAKAWMLANKDDEDAAIQPWDRKGYKMPGGTPSHPSLAQMLPAFPAGLRKQLKGAQFPAPEAIMSASVEGAQVDFDTASRIESRYFAKLVTGQNAKNMIQAFFFDLQQINSGALRPEGVPAFKPTKVAVLGAGMMGAGIAYVCARAGLEVVLKDVALESAERGKAYSAKINEKAVSRGKLTQEKSDELLARITATDNAADTKGCDLVIEAVFEDPSLKAQVFAEIAPYVNADALLCSNTSTLPITELAEGVDRPADFIGLHFFSPVDKMPLVEIIAGKETSDAAIAQAIDVVQLIKKTPIVVNDSRGFYTSRVIGTQINEGIAMLGEGVNPVSIDRATQMAGYPVGPLQITDELNMELMAKIRKASQGRRRARRRHVGAQRCGEGHRHDDRARSLQQAQGRRLLRLRRVRQARWASGPGWPSSSRSPRSRSRSRTSRTASWWSRPSRRSSASTRASCAPSAEANIGSIFGIGFPPATGGAIQYVNGFEGAAGRGPAGFVARARELAAAYGERFEPPASVVAVAEAGGTYPAA